MKNKSSKANRELEVAKAAKRIPSAAKAKAAEAPSPEPPKKPGTQRWPAACVVKGDFFQMPKSIVQRMGDFSTPTFQFKPHHLWLVMALQTDRFRDRVPRYYWAELASWAGVKEGTVRRWAYQLRDAGLLRIKQNRSVNPGTAPRPGVRNERNEFFLDPFEKATATVHEEWKEKKASRKPKL